MIAAGDLKDASPTPIGRMREGQYFVLQQEPVRVDYYRYGAIQGGGPVGYALTSKLTFVDTICVPG